MRSIIRALTDKIATRKGAWVTLLCWILLAGLLMVISPDTKSYKVSSLSNLLPDNLQSVVAEKEKNKYFQDADSIPAILAFQATKGDIPDDLLPRLTEEIEALSLPEVKELVPLDQMPAEAIATFYARDDQAAFLPLQFQPNLDTKEIKLALSKIDAIIAQEDDIDAYITGPAGIAVDTSDLFSRADFVLLFSTVGIILILLIITYRSPLLALIPLLSAGFIHQVVNQLLGFVGKAGIELASQSLSIMMILLFAVIIDYSLFIFSRFKEELKQRLNKYEAMQYAMRELGVPIFYSGSTILIAMLILSFAQFGDYRNFAPIFSIAVLVVMVAGLTLVPALFTLFGRRAFWPRTPQVGDNQAETSTVWRKIGRIVVNKPIISGGIVMVVLLISGSNVFQMEYEFDTMKSFPEDMPSRLGYEILEENFAKGDLAPTSIVLEGKEVLSEEDFEQIEARLMEEELVSHVRFNELTEDGKVALFDMTFTEGPYDVTAMDKLDELIAQKELILQESNVTGTLHFAGETAYAVDNRAVSDRDLVIIVVLETLFIFTMLIFLTRSFKIASFMMGTILISFVAALGLGVFLTEQLFGIDTVSNRVPVYAFVFLVALGIDYNIFLVSRYLEERKTYQVKEAVQIAVTHTGGVISSAGILLAATFAVLMTQPVEVLFVFGFIVAIGILLDTFLVRGVLMPALLVLFEKDK